MVQAIVALIVAAGLATLDLVSTPAPAPVPAEPASVEVRADVAAGEHAGH